MGELKAERMGTMKPQVVVVGQVARDLVLVVDELPGSGGSVNVRQRREILGGKGANIAVSLAQLGVPVALVGVVGDDGVGGDLLAQCRSDGIDLTALVQRPESESALIVDVVTRYGRHGAPARPPTAEEGAQPRGPGRGHRGEPAGLA